MVSDKKKWLYWSSQIGGWGILQVFIIILSLSSGSIIPTFNLLINSVFGVLIIILGTHVLRYIILKWNWLNESIWSILWKTFIAILILSMVIETFDVLLSYVLKKNYYVHQEQSIKLYTVSKFVAGTFFNIILFLLWTGFYYTYLFIEKSRNQEIKNLQFEASKNEIELKNLRAQINPHFLFNSLNSIKALVEFDKDEAKVAITKLSNLLRKSIQLGKNKLITLREELEIVNTYIDLEKIRFEERIRSEMIIDESALCCKIPPLMIQTLVENAIKHGLSKQIDGGKLILIIKKNQGLIDITIKNTGELGFLSSKKGVGLENTKKRLNILFGKSSLFKIEQDKDLVCVHIQFECKES